MTSATMTAPVSPAQREQFETQGFCVLERVLPGDTLAMLRDECARLMAEVDADADRKGEARPLKYFFSIWDKSEKLRAFMLSEFMAGIALSFLGDTVYVAFEQFVVKAAERGATFAWHQDSGYVPYPHQPYLTCWITLDDVTEKNGTVYMLPYDRAGTREVVPHVKDEKEWDLIGYTGPDPGDPVIAPAGSIACFASTVFHRSGTNTTSQIRRVFLPQYSREPLLKDDGTPFYLAEPVLRDGVRVVED